MSSAASTYETIAVRVEDRVAVIELSRPDALNAITLEMGRELLAALQGLSADTAVRCVILTGAGRAFSSGADLKSIGPDIPTLPSGKPDLGWALRELYNPIVLLLREMPQPVVAAVNGVAAGIGCSWALACDLVVAAPTATFLLAFRNVALVPDGGASLTVPARAGFGRGAEMALLGEQVTAQDALAWNLVNRVEDDALGAAMGLARRLADGPPEAQAAIKSLLNLQLLEPLRAQLAAEADAQTRRSDSDEVVEAVTAFLQKRPPDFGG
ncbi:MAG TPA: enoyl-CoA hydratase-related protein [Baekduia sp.]|nr:enoyl-CoA hydratase-related protein [Baekduia sp.]